MKKEGIIKRTDNDELTNNYGRLRYELTRHKEKYMFTCENFYLLIHPDIQYSLLACRIKDDIDLMPEIENTNDKTKIKFYKNGYNEKIYSKNELLAFIFASINSDWNIIEGKEKETNKTHYYLKYKDIIYDPSLAIITFEELYSKYYQATKEMENKDILNYLKEKNNLYNFYKKKSILKRKETKDFSINFISNIKNKFDKNVIDQYTLTKEKMEHIKEYLTLNNLMELRQVLSQERKSFLECNCIAVHPSIDKKILKKIDKSASAIYDLMSKEYGKNIDYYNFTIGNCYALSILLNLFDEDFKLIQGYIPYEKQLEFCPSEEASYLHSWTEFKDIVYDPALRVVTPKELYYKFAVKTDEFTKDQTEKILKRIGLNLTHFRIFLSGLRVDGDNLLMSRVRFQKIGSTENKEQGEKLIKLVKNKKELEK